MSAFEIAFPQGLCTLVEAAKDLGCTLDYLLRLGKTGYLDVLWCITEKKWFVALPPSKPLYSPTELAELLAPNDLPEQYFTIEPRDISAETQYSPVDFIQLLSAIEFPQHFNNNHWRAVYRIMSDCYVGEEFHPGGLVRIQTSSTGDRNHGTRLFSVELNDNGANRYSLVEPNGEIIPTHELYLSCAALERLGLNGSGANRHSPVEADGNIIRTPEPYISYAVLERQEQGNDISSKKTKAKAATTEMEQLKLGSADEISKKSTQGSAGAELAKLRHRETNEMLQQAAEYWRSNIDPTLSAPKAANILIGIVPLSHDRLKRLVLELKKEMRLA